MNSETLDTRLAQHAPYVWAQASRAAAQWSVPIEDLAQEGFLGLCIAHRKFRTNTGASFLTYATYWVRHKITRFAQKNHSLIRPPSTRFWAGRAPTLACIHLDAPVEGYADATHFHFPQLVIPDPADPPTHEASFSDSLHRLLQTLTPIQRQVLTLRFLEDLSRPEIAARLGVSPQSVDQIERRALRCLRKKITEAEALSRVL